MNCRADLPEINVLSADVLEKARTYMEFMRIPSGWAYCWLSLKWDWGYEIRCLPEHLEYLWQQAGMPLCTLHEPEGLP